MQSSAELEGILIAAKSVGLPFVIARLGLFWARGLFKQSVPQSRRRSMALTTVFVVMGVLGGYVAMNHEAWQFPPAQVMDWLPLLAILATIVLVPLEYFGAGESVWLAAQVVLVGISSWLMLPPATIEAGAVSIALWLLPMGVIWLAVWHLLDAFSTLRRSGIALALSAGALGFVVALGGSIVIGSAANSVMAALAAWLAFSVIGGWIPLPRALLGVLTLLFGCLLFAAYFYAEMPPALLGTVLLGLFSVQLKRLVSIDGEQHRWRELAINALATGLPLMAAVGFAVWSFLRQTNAD